MNFLRTSLSRNASTNLKNCRLFHLQVTNSVTQKNVCVIGGGVAGMSAVKSCVEEGLTPQCFESRKEIGGIWYYNRSEKLRRARAYESLLTNVSKEALCFSDFPYPKECTPYVSHSQFQNYLKSYVRHFDLEKYFSTSTEVVSVAEGGSKKWVVKTRNGFTDEETVTDFDSVIVCAGGLGKPKMPSSAGLLDGTFHGRVMHACEYDSPEDFNGEMLEYSEYLL